VHFSDKKIFEGYAKWVYELLCNLMKDIDRDRIMVIMTDHYRIMDEIFKADARDLLTEEETGKASLYLHAAIEATEKAVADISVSSVFTEGNHYEIRRTYLNAILRGETEEAYSIIDDAKNSGLSILVIYEEILSKVMHEIGTLWHKNLITVDKEHYATSVTQSVMSGFYTEIFSRPRKKKSLLSCIVGSELHEMGIRMLSDIFEYHGWDTYYLGGALPESALLLAIEEHKPQVVALSVTMAPYLSACEKMVESIREKFPHVKIAVGGQAFISTEELWKKWGVDFYSTSAEDLFHWADNQI
jgi:MerR family transcriptional regulator, light-induced transcriptional regulator